MTWKTFFFDGNSWNGVVDSLIKFQELLRAYDGNLVFLLDNAKRASISEIEKLPSSYYFGEARKVRTGEMPNFGFRREHLDGTETLGEWLKKNTIDLSESVPQ